MKELPAPPPSFAKRKGRILQQLSIPDSEYTDASPKGSIDAGIRDLIDEINGLDGFVTTSSCAGRVSVFVEGKKQQQGPGGDQGYEQEQEQERGQGAPTTATKPDTLAGVGGKGGGGSWLFVSHDPVSLSENSAGSDLDTVLGLGSPRGPEQPGAGGGNAEEGSSLVHFKFEPMILHVLTASPDHAQLLLRCGLQAGFRESGAINLTAAATPAEPATPMVAIRSMGLALESLVGVQRPGGVPQRTVSAEYLRTLLRVANDRFVANAERIQRFRAGLLDATTVRSGKEGAGWEDAQARRERMRAEGLRRKAELQFQQQQQQQQQQQTQLQQSDTLSGVEDADIGIGIDIEPYTALNAYDAT
ncbi:hypothetical protein SLS62_008654 [Diatrype stigma]|uniref:tRNA(Phe) 7-[(3-amino-3-carboxypropyl)-4-demethylwyosine(37)-N(4)]-methyltransferase n=1 Tax=Diatrype stigma TaxID=117547 RepID=A0AAN9UI85_9PEZI